VVELRASNVRNWDDVRDGGQLVSSAPWLQSDAVRLLLILVLVLILYGTLFPFHFDFHRTFENPAWILFHSWPRHFDRFTFRDTITNIFLYVPLGYVATLAFARRWWAAILLAAALSAGVEMLQVYEAARDCSLADVVCNVTGAAIGVGIAMAVPWHYHARTWNHAHIGPAILGACWVGFLLYPFIPLLSHGHLARSWSHFAAAPLSLPEIAATTAEWFAATLLIATIAERLRASWLALALLALPLRLVLADRVLAPFDIYGAVLALLLWAAIPKSLRTVAALTLMAAAIVLRELAPFDFLPESQPFTWIPFSATIEGNRLPAAAAIFRKAFDYGTVIWLCRGIGIIRVGAILAAALFVLEWVQRYLPGREPEITDSILALLLTAILAWSARR
jgi:VanZ family protein